MAVSVAMLGLSGLHLLALEFSGFGNDLSQPPRRKADDQRIKTLTREALAELRQRYYLFMSGQEECRFCRDAKEKSALAMKLIGYPTFFALFEEANWIKHARWTAGQGMLANFEQCASMR